MIIEGWRPDFNWRVIMKHHAIRYLFISSITGHFQFTCVKRIQSRNTGLKNLRYSETGSQILTWQEIK
jgi:hypothetical protein